MRGSAPRLLRRLAGAAAASGLALAGLVLVAAPASAAACSGTTGVTVVVDTGSSISTKCASGDPGSAMKALTSAGFTVVSPQAYPGTVVCRINGYPSSDPCVRMPPAEAYWGFFHAKRGGSWVYSQTGVASYDPAPGTVVGFRFGSGQQPRVAPPAPTKTSAPAPTTATPKATSTPRKTTSAPKPTSAPRTTSGSSTAATPGSGATSSAPTSTRPSASASASAAPSVSSTASATPSASASVSAEASASGEPSAVTAAPASQPEDASGAGTLLAGGALVAVVAGGAGVAAWKRRA